MRATETALVELGPDGVLSVRVRTNAAQSLANAKENLSAALEAVLRWEGFKAPAGAGVDAAAKVFG